MKSIWEYAEEEAIKRGEEAKRLEADPVYQAQLTEKRKQEFDRGVRLGWWDKFGNPLELDEDEDEDEED